MNKPEGIPDCKPHSDSRQSGRLAGREIARIPAEFLTGLGEVNQRNPKPIEPANGSEPFAIDESNFMSEPNVPKTSDQLTDDEIRASLSQTNCLGCASNPKKRAMSHCRYCYWKLPAEMRQNLYKRFGEGYEKAFRDSIDYLRKLATPAAA